MVSSAEQLRREILAGIAPPRIGPGRLAVEPAPGQLQTEQLQQAIDALSAAGGGVLELGPGVYTTGALRLKDGVELRLASPETRLCFTPEDPERNYPLVYAHWEATPCYNYSALLYASLCHGAVGGVCTAANFMPELITDVYSRYAAGDLAGSLEAQFKLNPVRLSMDAASFPVAAKDMAALRGRQVGAPYLPTLPTPEGPARQGFIRTMTAAGLL